MNYLIHHTTAGDVATVRIRGDLDVSTGATVAAALTAAVDESPVVVVHLAGVTFLDCHTVGVLVGAARRADHSGGRLVVVHPSPCVRFLLRTFDLDVRLCDPVGGDAPEPPPAAGSAPDPTNSASSPTSPTSPTTDRTAGSGGGLLRTA